MRKALLLTALLAGSLLGANAQTATADYVTAYVKPGTQKQLVIQLKNTDNYTAFQLQISLPTGVSFTDATPVLSDRQDASHQLHFNKVDAQNMNVAVFSYKEEGTTKTGNLAFNNDKNVLLTLDVDVTGTEFNANDIVVSGIEFVKVSTDDENLKGKALAITSKGILGDVKKDGVINTLDATYLLRKYAGRTMADYDAEAEDMNLDGSLSTLDATAVLREYARQ